MWFYIKFDGHMTAPDVSLLKFYFCVTKIKICKEGFLLALGGAYGSGNPENKGYSAFYTQNML